MQIINTLIKETINQSETTSVTEKPRNPYGLRSGQSRRDDEGPQFAAALHCDRWPSLSRVSRTDENVDSSLYGITCNNKI